MGNTKNKKDAIAKKLRWSVSDAVAAVTDCIRDSKLVVKKTKAYETAMGRLREFFHFNDIEDEKEWTQKIWILCITLHHYFASEGRWCDMSVLHSFVECNPMKAVKWSKYVKELENANLFITSDFDDDFNITNDVVNAVVENLSLDDCLREQETEDSFSFVKKIADRYENRRREDRSTRQLARELSKIEEKYSQLPFVVEVKKIFDRSYTRFMFYDCCSDFLGGGESSLNATVADLYDNSERYEVANSLMKGEDPLVKDGYLEFVKKGTLAEATLTLTQKAKEIFLGDKAYLFEEKLDEKLLIKPENIKVKRLFYSEENQRQIDKLHNAFKEDKLVQIQQRLKDSGMPVGVAVLLYGAPGTGKTESVYQIAKATGRPIVHVDISDTKSCWFGESEKKIKELFKNYRRMCETVRKQNSGLMPILLFNEADAVLSKRRDIGDSNTAQTENAIQNIILEEMENLEGIMVATTNLADNMDAAFERRFLFKVKFENPSVESKKHIWMDKLEWLQEEDALQFAKDYEFSGGQIDNIVRKITMNEVIDGKRPSIDEINEMCKHEKLSKGDVHNIGFSL